MNSDKIAHGIRVKARGIYVPQRSNPLLSHYFFAYKIQIMNTGGRSATLIGRHWIITDAHGRVEEVRGLGVVGEQPRLEPGTRYEYCSVCPLPTQSGTMRGFYHMVDDSGNPFAVLISPFELAIQASLN